MKEDTQNNIMHMGQKVNVLLNTEMSTCRLFLNSQCYTIIEQRSFLSNLTAVNGIDRLISRCNSKHILMFESSADF